MIVMDLPGHGDSTIPSPEDKIHVNDLIHDIHEVCEGMVTAS